MTRFSNCSLWYIGYKVHLFFFFTFSDYPQAILVNIPFFFLLNTIYRNKTHFVLLVFQPPLTAYTPLPFSLQNHHSITDYAGTDYAGFLGRPQRLR